MDFAVPSDHRVKLQENEKRQVLGPCQRGEKTVEDEGHTDCSWYIRNSSQRLGLFGFFFVLMAYQPLWVI